MFQLCPSDTCGGTCRGGEYLVEMRYFVEAYMDHKLASCEQIAEDCGCYYDDLCLSYCYAAAGLDGCGGDNGDDDWESEVKQYLECEAIADYDDDYMSVYVGAYCSSNGKNIYLGTFKDRQCSQKAAEGAYKSLKGRELPYTSESLVDNDCIACGGTRNNYYGTNQVLEFCEEIYGNSTKCERNLDLYNKDTGGCEYIHKILPRLEALANGTIPASTVFAWVFGITTLCAGGAVLFLFTKTRRGKVNLSSQGDKEEKLVWVRNPSFGVQPDVTADQRRIGVLE